MINQTIISVFKRTGSVRATSKATGYSWNRVVKSLSSSGIVINSTHSMILDLYDSGRTPDEIAKQLGLNTKTVQSYLPRIRPVYGEHLSKNAVRIKKCRKRKVDSNKKKELGDSL